MIQAHNEIFIERVWIKASSKETVSNCLIYAEVVTGIAGSIEAEGLPGSPQNLTCWNKLV